MTMIRDRFAPGYPTPVKLSGVLIDFDAEGLCRHPTDEQLTAVAATATRRERFEVVVETGQLGRRRRPSALPTPENPPSSPAAEDAPPPASEVDE